MCFQSFNSNIFLWHINDLSKKYLYLTNIRRFSKYIPKFLSHSVDKPKIYSHQIFIFSWNYLITTFFSTNVALSKFLSKKCWSILKFRSFPNCVRKNGLHKKVLFLVYFETSVQWLRSNGNSQCGTNEKFTFILRSFFDKNFVKATFLLKSWFHEMKIQWQQISRFSTLWNWCLDMQTPSITVRKN